MERIDSGRPISHVAAEAGVSRQRLGVWYRRWRAHGEQGLEDRPSTPVNMPKLLSEDIGDLIEEMRRGKKFGPARISGELALLDIKVSTATVHRELVRRGINRLRTIDPPTGEDKVVVQRYEHKSPGDMVHVRLDEPTAPVAHHAWSCCFLCGHGGSWLTLTRSDRYCSTRARNRPQQPHQGDGAIRADAHPSRRRARRRRGGAAVIVLSIPPAPSGDNVEVLSWVLVALVVIIVMGAILAILALVDFDRRNEAIHREIIGDVSSLKAWARRWGDLPPEPPSKPC